MKFSVKNVQNCTAFAVVGVDYLHLSNLLLLLLPALSLILVIRGDTNATDNAIYADLMPYLFRLNGRCVRVYFCLPRNFICHCRVVLHSMFNSFAVIAVMKILLTIYIYIQVHVCIICYFNCICTYIYICMYVACQWLCICRLCGFSVIR